MARNRRSAASARSAKGQGNLTELVCVLDPRSDPKLLSCYRANVLGSSLILEARLAGRVVPNDNETPLSGHG
jgi:hypothetical protein